MKQKSETTVTPAINLKNDITHKFFNILNRQKQLSLRESMFPLKSLQRTTERKLVLTPIKTNASNFLSLVGYLISPSCSIFDILRNSHKNNFK